MLAVGLVFFGLDVRGDASRSDVRESARQPTTAIQPDASSYVGPGRIIVVSNGRSGSTVFAETIAVFGESDAHAMDYELFNFDHPSDPTQYMKDYFAAQIAAQPEAHYVGFKWKSGECSDTNHDDCNHPTTAFNDTWE